MNKCMPLAGVLIAMIAMPAQQSFAAEDEPVFEEIVVTAQRREQSIYDVPVAISAFTGEGMEARGITNLVDIGKYVPNLNVTNFSAGQTSSANPFIRGIGLQDHLITTDPGVSVYVDGVYLGRQVGQNWSLSNIDRVEVLRGPQGTLYGRNSIGGAINIISRKPGEEDLSRVSLKAGSRGRLDGQLYGNFKLTDTIAVSASGAFSRREGLGAFNNVDTNTEVGEMEDVSGRVSLYWTPNEDFSVLITADGNEGNNGLNPYTTLIDELPNGAAAGAGLTNAQVGSRFDNNTGQADLVDTDNSSKGFSVTVEYDINENFNTKLIASRRLSDYTAGLDDDSTATNFLAFGERGSADQTSFELQLNGTYENWDFVSGLYYYEEDGKNNQPNFTFNAGGGSELLRQSLKSKAIYANVGFAVSDDLRIAAGLRYTKDEKDAFTDLIFGLIKSSASENFDEVSWDISATYQMNDDISVYGSIASGYQSGQFNPRPFCLFGSLDFDTGILAVPNCFDQDLDNITAVNYEVGIKGELFETLQMSVAVFYTTYKDLPYQVSTTAGAGFNTVNIIVDQDSSGIEWESSWRITDNFYLNTTLGYIDVDVDDPVAVAPLTPDLTFSISPELTIPMESGGTVVVRADYSYRDDMFGEPSADPGRMTGIDSRGLLNFDISYRSADESWLVALYGNNITNERYEQARLNTGDYILVILANDASEFGVRFTKEF